MKAISHLFLLVSIEVYYLIGDNKQIIFSSLRLNLFFEVLREIASQARND
jgi:hypothetical protein